MLEDFFPIESIRSAVFSPGRVSTGRRTCWTFPIVANTEAMVQKCRDNYGGICGFWKLLCCEPRRIGGTEFGKLSLESGLMFEVGLSWPI